MADGISKGIQLVMDEIGAIGKNKRNTMQGFNFRGIDDVMNTLHPLLAKANIFIVPNVLEIQREERTNAKGTTLIYTLAKVEYTFTSTEDRSTVTATVYGEGMDSGDKSLNKAMSIAMKYACFQIFCIPTEEMVDPDKESYEVAPKKQTAPAKPQYPPEFLNACKVRPDPDDPMTLGRLYKEDRSAFFTVIRHATEDGNSDLLAACQTIVRFMEVKNK